MNNVLAWVKSNLYIVIFSVIMVAAPVGFLVVTGKMNASVRQEVEDRNARFSHLSRIEKTKVDLVYPPNDPITDTLLVNPKFLDEYTRIAEQIERDVEKVQRKALEVNRRDRGVLLEELFPEPPVHQREIVPNRYYRVLESAYRELLDRIGAGAPPSAEKIRMELEAAEERLTTQIIISEELDDDERKWLTEQLTNTRLSLYADAAANMNVYATVDSIGMPHAQSVPPRAEGEGLNLLFQWQWDYWVKEDIINAIGAANRAADSVLEAPVKRVVSLSVLDSIAGAATVGGTGGFEAGGGAGGFNVGGGGIGKRSAGKKPPAKRGAPGASGGRTPARGGTQVNASAPVPVDYTASFTGRVSNRLYDVIYVHLELIVDSRRIPAVLDALSRQNFITIVDLRLGEVDAFAEAGNGYFYGPGQTSHLTLKLETIWLRKWVSEFMPVLLKQQLGIPVPAAGE